MLRNTVFLNEWLEIMQDEDEDDDEEEEEDNAGLDPQFFWMKGLAFFKGVHITCYVSHLKFGARWSYEEVLAFLTIYGKCLKKDLAY